MNNDLKTPIAKVSEIDKEFQRLDESIGYLNEVTKSLENRLESVLMAVPPSDVSEGEPLPNTKMAQEIRQFSCRVRGQASILSQIIDRLAI